MFLLTKEVGTILCQLRKALDRIPECPCCHMPFLLVNIPKEAVRLNAPRQHDILQSMVFAFSSDVCFMVKWLWVFCRYLFGAHPS